MRASIRSWLCIGWTFTLVATGFAQSPDVLRQMREMSARLIDPAIVLSPEQTREAFNRLDEWKLNPETLQPPDRLAWRTLESLVALGRGDARSAREAYNAAFKDQPEAVEVHRLGVLVGMAGGDALLSETSLKKLNELLPGDQRVPYAHLRRALATVGEPAPDVTLRSADLKDFSAARRRGKVLVLDFWNMLSPPAEADLAALRALHEAYVHSDAFEFVGVNADTEERTEQAKAFVSEKNIAWPQVYEFAARDARITHKSFKAGPPPWVVVIDAPGTIRAVGRPTDPGLVYAVRAAVAEADGEYSTVFPRTREGREAGALTGRTPPPAKPQEELRDDPEAQNLLTQARTHLRAGVKGKAKELFERIVAEFPGTKQAKEAQEYLDSIP